MRIKNAEIHGAVNEKGRREFFRLLAPAVSTEWQKNDTTYEGTAYTVCDIHAYIGRAQASSRSTRGWRIWLGRELKRSFQWVAA
jgi:hypothetical protein